MNWELIASDVQDGNKLIPNVKEELKEALVWAESDTLWAPDVVQLSDGKFYFYYNACKGDSPLSAMGVAVADDIEGPYVDNGIFLKSGKGLSVDETAPYDATKHPNVVDPHVFFDKEGKLWMVYGSYSGGIFIMELDPETGLPIEGKEYENQGYGKRLMGLNHSRIEGPYIQYSPDTDYYYLFVSFGGLSADGGYNLRVARSKNPDGPYYDSEGQDMANAHGVTGSFFDDRTIEQYGVKQIGNFKFSALGENTTSYGYVSPGHNSTYYDEETGKYFNIFHTRFPGKGEAHEVRVHQMLMNTKGWPIMTPHRYTGETVSSVSQDDVVGAYHYINHGKEITDEIKSSVYVELESDGTVSGAVTGTWGLLDDYFIKLVIDETEDGELVKKVYDGVFLRQWDPTSQREVMTFSALSNEGITVWGSQLLDMNDEIIADAVIDAIFIPEIAIDDLELPTVGSLGLPIE
nr:arabinosyl hydrolase [Xylanivirga thermophila]